jgi:hypothetical protein
MNWPTSPELFTVDCESCGAPIFVTPEDATQEAYIYAVTCPMST